jgi:hypothetical protein
MKLSEHLYKLVRLRDELRDLHGDQMPDEAIALLFDAMIDLIEVIEPDYDSERRHVASPPLALPPEVRACLAAMKELAMATRSTIEDFEVAANRAASTYLQHEREITWSLRQRSRPAERKKDHCE